MQIDINLKEPHEKQGKFIYSPAKRKVCRAGRRSGKTTGVAIFSVIKLLEGRRVLYATPTAEQLGRFWWEVTTALKPAMDAGLYKKNESEKFIIPIHGKSEARIKGKTAWNANTLRGDFADLLILDEYQLMDPEVWTRVGAPMLLDNDGDAVFIYTSEQKAIHASQLYKRAEQLQKETEAKSEKPRWEVFHFTSHDNPHLSEVALDEITGDMSELDFRLEIMAEDLDDDPRSLWTRDMITETRVLHYPELDRIVVGVDPQGGMVGETGIVVGGVAEREEVRHGYMLEDASISGLPETWAAQVVSMYNKYEADLIVAERNFGGDMVDATINGVDPNVPVKVVTASRGKMARAEPISRFMAKDRIHHVGEHPKVEDEMCLAGDTTVITRTGPVALVDLVDKELIVLGGDGEWHEATGHYLGKHQVYKVVIVRYGHEHELIATANHNWFVDGTPEGARHNSNKIKKTKTCNLRVGNRLMARKRRTLLSHARIEPVGVMSGFVYGDGWRSDKYASSGCGVAFYEHDKNVIPWFGPNVKERLRPFENSFGSKGYKLYGLPYFLKQIPDYLESASYLYGWLAGYFAADGTVSKRGQCVISSTNRESLEVVRHVAVILGIKTGTIRQQVRTNFGFIQDRYTGDGILYNLDLTASSLRKEFFLKDYHRERWLEAKQRGFKKMTWRWQISHIEPSSIQDVYCLDVPNDRRFVLAETNIISGNCQYYQTRSKNQPSPNRYDAYVWTFSELMLEYCATELGSISFPMV